MAMEKYLLWKLKMQQPRSGRLIKITMANLPLMNYGSTQGVERVGKKVAEVNHPAVKVVEDKVGRPKVGLVDRVDRRKVGPVDRVDRRTEDRVDRRKVAPVDRVDRHKVGRRKVAIKDLRQDQNDRRDLAS
ncbi:MAG: hypothetical protein N2C12_14370 [Planctomycetales bacterium]